MAFPFKRSAKQISRCRHLGFLIRTILAIFDLQVALILPTKFHSVDLSVQETKGKTDFQDCHHSSHLGYMVGKILPIFDLQVAPTRPPFLVNWPFGSREEAQNRSSRWWHSWIFDQNNFS